MGMAQFAKVVLLPQGEFAAFLRATPEDRREVLERLFDITAFADVEAWLAETRRTAGAELEQAWTTLSRPSSRGSRTSSPRPGPAAPTTGSRSARSRPRSCPLGCARSRTCWARG